MKHPWLVVAVLVLVCAAAVLWISLRSHQGNGKGAAGDGNLKGGGPTAEDGTDNEQARVRAEWKAKQLARGREIAKTAPKRGSTEWVNWYMALSSDDRLAWALAEDELLTPAEPTQAQKDAAKIESRSAGKGQFFPAKTVLNYKPLLRMTPNISVRPLQVATIERNGGFLTTIWARRAQNSIVIDWGNQSVIKGNVDSAESGNGPAPQYIPPGMNLGGHHGDIMLKISDSQWFHLPWHSGSTLYPLALDKDYQYAFGSEQVDATHRVENIVVVDIAKKQVAGNVPVPPAKNGVHCIFQPKQNYMMIFDYDWEWIMMLDLSKPNVTAEEKSSQNIPAESAAP